MRGDGGGCSVAGSAQTPPPPALPPAGAEETETIRLSLARRRRLKAGGVAGRLQREARLSSDSGPGPGPGPGLSPFQT
jgi:hypothetical protein